MHVAATFHVNQCDLYYLCTSGIENHVVTD